MKNKSSTFFPRSIELTWKKNDTNPRGLPRGFEKVLDKYSAKGFSIVEVILASAMFMLFSTAAVTLVLRGFDANRLGSEETIANQFASEGIEAVKSIKNQAYTNLITPSPIPRAVRRNVSNVWEFNPTDGSNNTLIHNGSDNYVRQVKIEPVNRDASGNIVASGGINSQETKKITSTVNWNFNSARPESVSLISYLSDFRKTIYNGILFYGDTVLTSTFPKFRQYTGSSNIFTAQADIGVPGVAVGKSLVVRTSPIKHEAIAGYIYTSGSTATLQIVCYDGYTWTNDWSVVVNSAATANTRKFDIAYETNSGDVLVAYSRNATATNAVDYRTKLGTTGCGSANWSGASSIPTTTTLTSGNVQWVKMAWDKRSSSNLITAIWADSSSKLGAAIWNGTTFGNLPSATLESTTLEVASSAQDVDSFDVEYESLSGDVLVVWSALGSGATNLLKYKTCTVGVPNCIWQPTGNIPTVADAGTNLDISANPNSDDIVLGALDNGSGDLSIAYWTGNTNAWTGSANVDTSSHCPVAGDHLVSTGWLINGSTTRSIVVYHDATSNTCTTGTTNVGYYIGNGTSFSAGTDFTPSPAFGNPQKWYDIQMDPFNKEQLILTVSDANNDLFAKRLVTTSAPAFTWTDVGDGTTNTLQANLGQTIANPFSFAYWQKP